MLLYNGVLSFESVDEIVKCDIKEKLLAEQYFPVVLFMILYKVILSFECVDENNP